MLKSIAKIIGGSDERVVRKMQPDVDAINALEPGMEGLSDSDLRAKTGELRARIRKGEDLDDLVGEAFAVVREAARRTLGQRHFDVQLVGGMVLHSGKIAEMRTGEGKTLVATLPAYLNAPHRSRRARGHRQRLPGPAGRPMDGLHIPHARPVGRHSPARFRLPL